MNSAQKEKAELNSGLRRRTKLDTTVLVKGRMTYPGMMVRLNSNIQEEEAKLMGQMTNPGVV